MKKSSWIILALIVALGLIYFLTREDQVSVGIKRLKLPVFAVDKADRIEIKSKENVNLVKLDGKWMLELKDKDRLRPVRADQSNVASMLDAALGVRHSHYVTNIKEKESELGLLGDEATLVKIFSGDTVVWELVLGKNAAGSGRYAKRPDDNDVYVVKGSFWQLTRHGPVDWRDRDIMPVKEGEITSFKVFKNDDPYLSVAKEKDSEDWKFDDQQKGLPTGFRADKNALANLVRSAVNLKASGFIDEPRDLTSLVAKLIVVGNDDKTHEVLFYKGSDDNYLAKRAGDEQIYEISKYNFERINRPIAEFRDMSLLSFDKAAVKSLTLAHGKDKIMLSKKDGNWQIDQPSKLPEGFEFDPVSVDDLLGGLSSLSAQRIAGPKDKPEDPNWQNFALLELVMDSGEKIQLNATKRKASAEEFLAKGNIDQEIYVVTGSRIASLISGINAFKKEHFEMPAVDESTRGFESLPKDLQRRLLEATQKKK